MAKVFAMWSICTVNAIHQGAVKIHQDGATFNLHVAALSGNLVTTSGTSVTMTWGGEIRAFVTRLERDDMPSFNYYNFTLLNKELSYDIDLSMVGCSCNAALFFTSMPGYHKNGSVAHGDLNPYYCDANDVGGVWCWEHDTIEANMYTMQTTPHECNSPEGGYISSCDKGGCGGNAFDADPAGFCPDAHCKIDTRKPFRIFQRFEANPGRTKLTRIVNRLVQGSSTFEWPSCNQGYLERMTGPFRGNMVMVFQLWGDTYERMSWLDSMTGCTGSCNADTAEVTFSNIAINSLVLRPGEIAACPTWVGQDPHTGTCCPGFHGGACYIPETADNGKAFVEWRKTHTKNATQCIKQSELHDYICPDDGLHGAPLVKCRFEVVTPNTELEWV